MAASIDPIVSVNITNATVAVSQPSFAIPMVVGSTSTGWANGDYVHTYSSPAGMLTDGYTTSSPEYVYASTMFANTITIPTFKAGRRGTAAVAQLDTFSVNTLTSGHVYSLSVNGTLCTFTAGGSDTQQSVLTALRTQIIAAAPVTGSVTGSGSGATLPLTASVAGQVITYSGVDSLLTRVANTAAAGVATDLANIAAQDSTWYGFSIAAATDAEILQAAAWAEGNKKFYAANSSTSAIGTSATTDVFSQGKAAGYNRTLPCFFVASAGAGQGGEFSWMASQLAQTPGSTNWAYKSIPGVTADTLTSTQQSILIGVPDAQVKGKNVNIYQNTGGTNVTLMGTMCSGQFADITVGLDWLQSTIQTNVYSALINAAKIPYTNAGVGVLISAVSAAIQQGVVNGLIDGASSITISAPDVLSVSANQRANRVAPTITFTCRLQGAINAVQVNGTVSV